MDIKELQVRIEEKRKELNKLAACNLSSLSAQEIVKISHELNELITAYFEIYGVNKDYESTE